MTDDLYYVTFTASDAMFDEHGPLHGREQIDSLTLGPFPSYVELTYEFLRVGPNGDNIAAFADGFWKVGFERTSHGDTCTITTVSDNALIFSDVTISCVPPASNVGKPRTVSFTVPERAYGMASAILETVARLGTLPDTPATDPRTLHGLLAEFVAAIDAAHNIAHHSDYYRLVLELSTAHITQETNFALGEHALHVPSDATALPVPDDRWPNVLPTRYGHMVHVPYGERFNEHADRELDIPSDLRRVLQHAHDNHAAWVLLDRDGPVDETLPTYDWS